jgi:predicted transcriptional regulator
MIMSEVLEKPRAVNVTVKLDESERSSLKSLALAKQRTPHFLMKEAIARYIEEEEAEQAAIAVAAASLEHYQKTGLHTTLAEMKDWAQAVRKDRSLEMPACHT